MGTLQNKYKPYQISTLFILCLYQLIITLNLTRAFPQAPQNDQDLVSFACNHTLYQEICISSLKSDPRTKTASDLKAIATIALDQTATQATQTESYIDELLEKSHGSYGQKNGRSLEDCQEEYGEAVEDLREATEALSHGKYDDVNELVSGAMTDCQTCLDESEERESSKSSENNNTNELNSFKDKNQHFYKLCSNVLAIVKLLG